MMGTMRIALVTVTYNNARDAVALLRCLERCGDTTLHVIVVDNDSAPEERSLLGAAALTSGLTLDILYNDENRGFSGGCNAGMRRALSQDADWMLLLNPDTTVNDAFVSELRAALPAEPGIAQLPLDEGVRVTRAGSIRWLRATLPHRTGAHPGADEYAVGAAMLVHRQVVERIGFLDERYFLYFEDADYSVRARDAGFPFTTPEGPRVHHRVSSSTRSLGAPLLLRYHMRNALLFNCLHGPWWARISLHIWAFFAIFKQAIKTLLAPERRPHARAIALGIADFYASRFGRIPTNDPPHRY